MKQELKNALENKYNLLLIFNYLFYKNNVSNDKTFIKYGKSRFCFYNALSYAKENNTDLMWGIIITENATSLTMNLHGFCYADNKIIDVTYNGPGLYAYEKINKEIWYKWENNCNLFKEYVLDRIYDINKVILR
jgi:hypothetical protein